MVTPRRRPYWFPAKRYGWGWGLPATWQGWLVLAGWLGVILVAVRRLMPQHPLEFAAIIALDTLLLVWICYLTGEPPRWRWGA